MFYDFWKTKKRTRFGASIVRAVNRKMGLIVSRSLAPESAILEIGCGNGLFLREAIARGLRYTGIEPNKNLARDCRAISAKAHIINDSVPPIRAGLKRFDAVYMSHVLEHFADHREALNVLGNIHSVLKNGGLFFLFFPDYLSFGADFFDIDYSHEYITTTNRVRYLLQDSGFEICRHISFRGAATGFVRILAGPFFFSVRLCFGILYSLTGAELYLKAKTTFGRNVLVIARKK